MMAKERDNTSEGGETSNFRLSHSHHHISDRKFDNPDRNIVFPDKGIDFLRESNTGYDWSKSKPPQTGNSPSQELTLSYLCDNSKLSFPGREISGDIPTSYKGKEIAVSDDRNPENNIWVERDFLQLNEIRSNSSKREVELEEIEMDNRDKKPKLETLNLSLSLPDVSLSLSASNLKPTQSLQSLIPSNNNTQTTYSNDFTVASFSYSHSHPYSHNPSCSLTRNSTENHEIWNCGEGTNGSVHSRFRPVGDGVSLSNHGGGGVFSLLQGGNHRQINKDSCNNGVYQPTNSDNNSFFPSELPARPENAARVSKSSPERILLEIVSEPIPELAQTIQELSDESVQFLKDYLKILVLTPERRDELVLLQNKLERRSDLSNETLSKAHKTQVEIMVTIKTGLTAYLSNKIKLVPAKELIEIFFLERCKNLNCKRMLPVDDCDCKICSKKKGFCSECMCPICFNFDCANNTCSWVGCDVCSHWCHAACGIEKNLIRPGPALKGGPPGTTEMQFHCIGCGHASEMFGFVKDVFVACAKEWGKETLVKELECVGRIFRGSEDFKGKELHLKAGEMVKKLENKTMSPSDVCGFVTQFFKYTEGLSDFPFSSIPSKELPVGIPLPAAGKPCLYPKPPPVVEDEWSVKRPKKEGFESLESIVRVKEAEARMFQNRADEARREAEGYRLMARMKNEKFEEEYGEKLAKLCLKETEERRRKTMEELRVLENSHCDYYKMKMRMQTDIAGLLERMEVMKQQLV